MLVFSMFELIFGETFNISVGFILCFVNLQGIKCKKVFNIVLISSLRAEAAAIFKTHKTSNENFLI